MIDELKIKISNSIDLNNETISSLITVISYDKFNVIKRDIKKDSGLYSLDLSFNIYLKNGVDESKYDAIVDFLQKSILSNKDTFFVM